MYVGCFCQQSSVMVVCWTLLLQHGLDALPGFSAFTTCIESVSLPSLAHPLKDLEDGLKPKMYCKVQLQDSL